MHTIWGGYPVLYWKKFSLKSEIFAFNDFYGVPFVVITESENTKQK